MLSGYMDRMQRERRLKAWALHYQLVAAGCKPESVTVEKLLGEDLDEDAGDPAGAEPAKQRPIDEIWRMMPRMGGPE
jgi:hypothetical protein